MSETPTQYISERQLGAVREDIPLKTKLMTMNKEHWEGIKKIEKVRNCLPHSTHVMAFHVLLLFSMIFAIWHRF